MKIFYRWRRRQVSFEIVWNINFRGIVFIKFKSKTYFSFPYFHFFLLDRNIPPFYACLKEERDLWFTLISEISAAQKNAFALKEKKLIDQGKSNIILGLALMELQYPLKTAEGNF